MLRARSSSLLSLSMRELGSKELYSPELDVNSFWHSLWVTQAQFCSSLKKKKKEHWFPIGSHCKFLGVQLHPCALESLTSNYTCIGLTADIISLSKRLPSHIPPTHLSFSLQ